MALRAAEKSMVLLKNDGILPLNRNNLHSIAVIGPAAYSQSVLYGNYHGDSDNYITHLDGIRAAAGEDIRVYYSQGCHLFKQVGRFLSEAAVVAKCADVIVLCVGLDETLEGEEGDAGNSYASGDKPDLLLPETQQELVERVLKLGKPTILVCCSGSAIDLSSYEDRCSAIIQAWYSGQSGGEALGRILFGMANPSGKLPVTFYYNRQNIPEFTDYRMSGRTYKYVKDLPWRPFGFGMSYSHYVYENLAVSTKEDNLQVDLSIKNTGLLDGEEVIQIYSRYEEEAFEKPIHTLVGFQRVAVPAQQTLTVKMSIPIKELESVLEDGSRRLLDGTYTLFVGGSQPDERSAALLGRMPLATNLQISKGKIT
jgi:beta-glucosidase